MFSVIIPVYNSESTIGEVLNGIKRQTRVDLIDEVILINDGSTDGSVGIISKYKDENTDLNIKIIDQKNKGVSAARNAGMKAAVAEWIAFCDSDDVWHDNKIERQAEVILENPGIVLLGCLCSEPPLRILWHKHFGLYKTTIEDLCWRNVPGTPSIVIHREETLKVGFFNEKMRYGEDINYFQKFCIYYNYYILCENLFDCGIQKSAYGESGLSSNLYRMHLGRCQNTREAYELGAISQKRYLCMQMFNQIKYVRRRFLVWRSRFGGGYQIWRK